MITLLISIVMLIVGYFVYGRICEKIFEIDPDRPTPAYSDADGIDFVALPRWKSFLIQFLNIAGLGPIFGAVAGAAWGPIAFLWIVLGCLIAGGVHDYFSGMLSVRNSGKSFTEISGMYLGNQIQFVLRILTFVLLIMVGVVFFVGPANILVGMIKNDFFTVGIISTLILIYYFISTILPIDKVIGKLYPIFGIIFLFMSASIFGALFYYDMPVAELSIASFTNFHSNPGQFPAFPMLFVTIACGAVSGFHATQSPIIARCLKNEKEAKSVFFGTMATEGVVALIWAAVSMSFFGGIRELNIFMDSNGGNAALAVNRICNELLGPVGGAIALIGVVIAPITSGDTAFRSARMLIADIFKIDQKNLRKRLILSSIIFVIAYFISKTDFSIIWRYFAWTNQTLATFVLWTIAVYLLQKNKFYWLALVPALFMSMVVVSYILLAPEGFSLAHNLSYMIAGGVCIILAILFFRHKSIYNKKRTNSADHIKRGSIINGDT